MEDLCVLEKGSEMDHNVGSYLLESLGSEWEPNAKLCEVHYKLSQSVTGGEFLSSR